MDANRRGDNVFVHFDAPGVGSDSIDLVVEKDVLAVKAETTGVESAIHLYERLFGWHYDEHEAEMATYVVAQRRPARWAE
jgi:hypothetical protein